MEWKRITAARHGSEAASLGNFLSGMETICTHPSRLHSLTLGNFLSGMETGRRTGSRSGRRGTLETSLVEWKHE